MVGGDLAAAVTRAAEEMRKRSTHTAHTKEVVKTLDGDAVKVIAALADRLAQLESAQARSNKIIMDLLSAFARAASPEE